MGKGLWLTFVMLINLPLTGDAKSDEELLGQTGDWVVIRKVDPFADPQQFCTIQTPAKDGGGRRERPTFRVSLNSTFFVDPTITLTTGIRLIRKINDVRDDEYDTYIMPSDELMHDLRVDDGEVVEVVFDKPEFGVWAVHESDVDVRALVSAMSKGDMLYYRWKLDRASETFQIDLDGFAEGIELANRACRD